MPKWQQTREGGRGRGQGQGQHQHQHHHQQQQHQYPQQQQQPQMYNGGGIAPQAGQALSSYQQNVLAQQGYYSSSNMQTMQGQYPVYEQQGYGTQFGMNQQQQYAPEQHFVPYQNGTVYPPMGGPVYYPVQSQSQSQPQPHFPQQPHYVYNPNPNLPPQQPFYPPQASSRMTTPSQPVYPQQPPPVAHTPTAHTPYGIPPTNGIPPAIASTGYISGPEGNSVEIPLPSNVPMVSSGSPDEAYMQFPVIAASSAPLPLSVASVDTEIAGSGSGLTTTEPSAAKTHEPSPPSIELPKAMPPSATPTTMPVAAQAKNLRSAQPALARATIVFAPEITPHYSPDTTWNSPPSSPNAGSRLPKFNAPLPWTVESDPTTPWPSRVLKGKKKKTRSVASQASVASLQPLAVQRAVSTQRPVTPQSSKGKVSRPTTPSVNRSKGTPASPLTTSSPKFPKKADNDKSKLPGAGKGNGEWITPNPTKPSAKSAPVVPALPKTSSKDTKPISKKSENEVKEPISAENVSQESNIYTALATSGDATSDDAKAPVSVISIKAEDEGVNAAVDVSKPSSDAGKSEAKPITPSRNIWTVDNVKSKIVGAGSTSVKNGTASPSDAGATPTNAKTLAEALKRFNPTAKDSKVTFIKPRGLHNTGNMCYMNSVLQVLVFCPPFYNFLSLYGKHAVHSFNSDNPLLEAMYMFMREFSAIDTAKTPEQLKLRLKKAELEQYGEDLNPKSVYDAMTRIPRFVDMQQGHQQDAQEFLGFLLETLHDECARIIQASFKGDSTTNGLTSPGDDELESTAKLPNGDDEWLRVGPKQKPALTRSSGTSGTSITTPLTKIFGGNQRSDLRVQGQKDSITMQPYTSLQLDIGEQHVRNIIDALKTLTRPEALRGNFNMQKRDQSVLATKQVFIDTLPPILILHLKRFQYDDKNGPQKIWKEVGYPLELELPKEMFSRQQRKEYELGGTPKYRLTAVVYHHGPNASGGHYTVDVRRQDGTEWVRLDDTKITRIRDEDVAAEGNGEESKNHANGKNDDMASNNPFQTIDQEIEEVEERGWKQAAPGKKWSALATGGNGTSTPKRNLKSTDKFSVDDNKVAYLLFYQRMS